MTRPHPHPIAAPTTSEEGGRSPQRSTCTGATTTGTVRPAAAESPRHSANDVSTRGGGGTTIHGADHLSGGLYAGAAVRTPPDGFPPDGAQDVYAQGNRGMAIHGTDRMSGELDAGTAAHTPLARFPPRSAVAATLKSGGGWAPGLVPCLQSPVISKLAETSPSCKMLYDDSQQIYNQLGLISHMFMGEVLGPVCLYFGSAPEQEDTANVCVRRIDTKILMKVVVTKAMDASTIQHNNAIEAEIYMLTISGPSIRSLIPPSIEDYHLNSLVASHALAWNTVISLLERVHNARRFEDDPFSCEEENGYIFDTVENLLRLNGIDDFDGSTIQGAG